MKPTCQVAMQQMIDAIKQRFPFSQPTSFYCSGQCVGCAKKLLQFMEMQLELWQMELDNGEIPDFAELAKRGKQAKKIEAALIKNGLIAP